LSVSEDKTRIALRYIANYATNSIAKYKTYPTA
jgi:hypothetical protein